jgi:hypothetical protein
MTMLPHQPTSPPRTISTLLKKATNKATGQSFHSLVLTTCFVLPVVPANRVCIGRVGHHACDSLIGKNKSGANNW